MPMASCVHNGNNETNIGKSQSISVSFSENNGNEVEIRNSGRLIDIWVSRDVNIPRPNVTYVNSSEHINNNTESDLFPIGITTSILNSSIHVELLPVNVSVGYLFLLKFNMRPKINETFQSYHHWKLFCPSGKFYICF